MLWISNLSAFYNALSRKGIIQDTCETRYVYDAKLAYLNVSSTKTVSLKINALAKSHWDDMLESLPRSRNNVAIWKMLSYSSKRTKSSTE